MNIEQKTFFVGVGINPVDDFIRIIDQASIYSMLIANGFNKVIFQIGNNASYYPNKYMDFIDELTVNTYSTLIPRDCYLETTDLVACTTSMAVVFNALPKRPQLMIFLEKQDILTMNTFMRLLGQTGIMGVKRMYDLNAKLRSKVAEIPGSDGIPKSIRESWNSKLFESQAHIGRASWLIDEQKPESEEHLEQFIQSYLQKKHQSYQIALSFLNMVLKPELLHEKLLANAHVLSLATFLQKNQLSLKDETRLNNLFDSCQVQYLPADVMNDGILDQSEKQNADGYDQTNSDEDDSKYISDDDDQDNSAAVANGGRVGAYDEDGTQSVEQRLKTEASNIISIKQEEDDQDLKIGSKSNQQIIKTQYYQQQKPSQQQREQLLQATGKTDNGKVNQKSSTISAAVQEIADSVRNYKKQGSVQQQDTNNQALYQQSAKDSLTNDQYSSSDYFSDFFSRDSSQPVSAEQHGAVEAERTNILKSAAERLEETQTLRSQKSQFDKNFAQFAIEKPTSYQEIIQRAQKIHKGRNPTSLHPNQLMRGQNAYQVQQKLIKKLERESLANVDISALERLEIVKLVKDVYAKRLVDDGYFLCDCPYCKRLLLPFLLREDFLQLPTKSREKIFIKHRMYFRSCAKKIGVDEESVQLLHNLFFRQYQISNVSVNAIVEP